jgi:hypothetical protein
VEDVFRPRTMQMQTVIGYFSLPSRAGAAGLSESGWSRRGSGSDPRAMSGMHGMQKGPSSACSMALAFGKY